MTDTQQYCVFVDVSFSVLARTSGGFVALKLCEQTKTCILVKLRLEAGDV